MTLKKQPTIAVFLILAIATFIAIKMTGLSSEHAASYSKTIAEMNGCAIQNNYCEFIVDQQIFEVSFVNSPLVEEENRANISSKQKFTISRAWIEGINMYMGKTPVIIESATDNSAQVLYFLGSCNLETMQWRMLIQLEQKTHPVEVRFETTQY